MADFVTELVEIVQKTVFSAEDYILSTVNHTKS